MASKAWKYLLLRNGSIWKAVKSIVLKGLSKNASSSALRENQSSSHKHYFQRLARAGEVDSNNFFYRYIKWCIKVWSCSICKAGVSVHCNESGLRPLFFNRWKPGKMLIPQNLQPIKYKSKIQDVWPSSCSTRAKSYRIFFLLIEICKTLQHLLEQDVCLPHSPAKRNDVSYLMYWRIFRWKRDVYENHAGYNWKNISG